MFNFLQQVGKNLLYLNRMKGNSLPLLLKWSESFHINGIRRPTVPSREKQKVYHKCIHSSKQIQEHKKSNMKRKEFYWISQIQENKRSNMKPKEFYRILPLSLDKPRVH